MWLKSIESYRVHPLSLSIKTFVKDKNGIDIYGSFPLPSGEMSRGGDIIQHDVLGKCNIDITYMFKDLSYYPIIGNQWEQENDN
jgi:hypothetical protein